MIDSEFIQPHGGSLCHLLAEPKRADDLREEARQLPEITLNDRQLCDLELLAVGGFSPLQGFMSQSDYEVVLERMALEDGTVWPVPICLDVPESLIDRLEIGRSAALLDPEGFLLAVLHVEDLWPADLEKEAEAVYGTADPAHPGAAQLHRQSGTYYVGGRLEVISPPLHFDFKRLRLTPAEVRTACRKLGWQRLAGFQTRHPLHRPQFEMTMEAMRRTKANLLIQPIVGVTHPGDFDYFTRIRCCQAVTTRYPANSLLMGLLPLSLRAAGPREALLQAVVAKNYGCTHFIIGPDHASPPGDVGARRFYEPDAARRLLEDAAEFIGIEPVGFEEMVYLTFEDEFRTRDLIPEGTEIRSLSGSEIRKRVRTGRRIPGWATFPEVVRELRRAYPPPRKQGLTIFLTGLSGAGKSTLAKVLYFRLLELGDRPVTLLDGDIVRRHLSSQLGFSKEHRDINVRRIGFVASEITKNRGIAICAPIAPYARTRGDVRQAVYQYGGFIEVHVATPLEICEKRDRKGVYAKARAGLIKGFTGVDDPYEAPETPEVRVDMTHLTPDEAAQEILLCLGQQGFI